MVKREVVSYWRIEKYVSGKWVYLTTYNGSFYKTCEALINRPGRLRVRHDPEYHDRLLLQCKLVAECLKDIDENNNE